ncbi:aspartic peptidase domain-containing protein [Xylariomycetidae sp. FL0641]|nr:aspartic peptidase domain-containing protein [Xylariomycetidae sp. FL0641]
MKIALAIRILALLSTSRAVAADVWDRSSPSVVDNHTLQTTLGLGPERAIVPGINIPLTAWVNGSNKQWYSNISVGTPSQNLTVLWDTGSTDLLIPGTNCTTCGEHRLFNPNESSTYAPVPNPDVSIPFISGPGAEVLAEPEVVHGLLSYDTIAVGPLNHSSQAILVAQDTTDTWNRVPVDGIMGLGPVNVSVSEQDSFFWNLYAHEQLRSPVFSLYLPDDDDDGGAQLTLGGVDHSKHDGEISYLSLERDRLADWSTWVFGLAAVYANGSHVSHDDGVDWPVHAALLKTGTPYNPRPGRRARAGAPCGEAERLATTNLTFTLTSALGAALNVSLPGAALNRGEVPGLPGICRGVFAHPVTAPVAPSPPYWVLGSPLLARYYTVWDGVNLQVGWARPKGAGEEGEAPCTCTVYEYGW